MPGELRKDALRCQSLALIVFDTNFELWIFRAIAQAACVRGGLLSFTCIGDIYGTSIDKSSRYSSIEKCALNIDDSLLVLYYPKL